jgi:hypothetical protein
MKLNFSGLLNDFNNFISYVSDLRFVSCKGFVAAMFILLDFLPFNDRTYYRSNHKYNSGRIPDTGNGPGDPGGERVARVEPARPCLQPGKTEPFCIGRVLQPDVSER